MSAHSPHSPGKPVVLIAVLAAAIVLGCMIYKAATASMTHDESSTFLNIVALDNIRIWKCHSDPACWTTANNHLLNTQMMRWSSALLGDSEFALRLPNLLLLVLYLFCAVGFVRDSARSITGALCCFVLLVLNPFVLDFFALARGYGMGLGWMMASLWCIWRFAVTRRPLFLALAFVGATAAVFSNLTYLAYAATLTCSLVLYLIVQWMIDKRQVRVPFMLPASIIACWAFLGWYFYEPVRILIGLGEFAYGAGTLWETWEGMVRDSLYGVQWFGEQTVRIAAFAALILSIAAAVLPWINRQQGHHRTYGRFLSLLCVSGVLFFVLNHHLNGAFYPSGRKSILLVPPLALLWWFSFSGISKWHRAGKWLAALVALAITVHLVRAFQPAVYREWWYDSTTKQMVLEIASHGKKTAPVSLAVEWIFHPTTHFYVQTLHLPVDLRPYSKEILPDSGAQYYYVHPDKAETLEPVYAHEKTLSGRWLMRRIQSE